MRWSTLAPHITALHRSASQIDPDIREVQYDSRRVATGDVFVAMRGGSVDGNHFIADVLTRGAAAIITDSAEAFDVLAASHTPALLVTHGRRALSEAASALFGAPERALAVTAITGTNGKTTTAFLLKQLLTMAGRKCILIGTIETRIAGTAQPSAHTTPEASDLLRIFADGVAADCTEVVMEMSSHALAQERAWGVPVDVAVFTNLTQDHLDFHPTMEDYFAAKARLFQGVGTPPPRVAVINADDPYATRLNAIAEGSRSVSYGLTGSATCRATNITAATTGTRFTFETPLGAIAIASPLIGGINVSNLLAAMCAAIGRGLLLDQIAELVTNLRAAPGRFEVVPASASAGFTVVVDYAHTDDALRNLISIAREQVSTHRGRVITVFGCGGDRDRTKRPKMGRVAGEGSDIVIITSDNPRSEDPASIIQEILVGMRDTAARVLVEQDRRTAIEVAIDEARPGDIVLIAGKGHEKTQTIGTEIVSFDDVAVASEVLLQIKKGRTA